MEIAEVLLWQLVSIRRKNGGNVSGILLNPSLLREETLKSLKSYTYDSEWIRFCS